MCTNGSTDQRYQICRKCTVEWMFSQILTCKEHIYLVPMTPQAQGQGQWTILFSPFIIKPWIPNWYSKHLSALGNRKEDFRALPHIVSWEAERHYQYLSIMFCWEPERCFRCTKSVVIGPLWFSTEHRWTSLTPLWFSTNNIFLPLNC